ncbi:hypothetical protein, partial [Actinopolymorpha pittospori]|uniref:hypothetical protein n=1 Tax=Actinopolymorpha pittospori TaxID=648752 RepID=UPI0031E95482
ATRRAGSSGAARRCPARLGFGALRAGSRCGPNAVVRGRATVVVVPWVPRTGHRHDPGAQGDLESAGNAGGSWFPG